jgi:type 1 fimbria pilin
MSLSDKTVLLALLSGCLSPGALAYDTQIAVTGNLIGNSCTVTADSRNINVQLGAIGTRQLSAAGSLSDKIPFIIKLEECAATFTGVKISFTATPDPDNPQLIKVNGDAGGVAIQLMDEKQNPLALGTQTEAYGLTGNNSVALKFYASLIAKQTTVSAGTVSATATWVMEYQ